MDDGGEGQVLNLPESSQGRTGMLALLNEVSERRELPDPASAEQVIKAKKGFGIIHDVNRPGSADRIKSFPDDFIERTVVIGFEDIVPEEAAKYLYETGQTTDEHDHVLQVNPRLILGPVKVDATGLGISYSDGQPAYSGLIGAAQFLNDQRKSDSRYVPRKVSFRILERAVQAIAYQYETYRSRNDRPQEIIFKLFLQSYTMEGRPAEIAEWQKHVQSALAASGLWNDSLAVNGDAVEEFLQGEEVLTQNLEVLREPDSGNRELDEALLSFQKSVLGALPQLGRVSKILNELLDEDSWNKEPDFRKKMEAVHAAREAYQILNLLKQKRSDPNQGPAFSAGDLERLEAVLTMIRSNLVIKKDWHPVILEIKITKGDWQGIDISRVDINDPKNSKDPRFNDLLGKVLVCTDLMKRLSLSAYHPELKVYALKQATALAEYIRETRGARLTESRIPAIVTALEAKLTDDDWRVRQSAAQALGLVYPELVKQNKNVSLTALEAKLTDDDSDVRQSAAQALGLVYPELVKQNKNVSLTALEAKLTDANSAVRQSAAQALGKLALILLMDTSSATTQGISSPGESSIAKDLESAKLRETLKGFSEALSNLSELNLSPEVARLLEQARQSAEEGSKEFGPDKKTEPSGARLSGDSVVGPRERNRIAEEKTVVSIEKFLPRGARFASDEVTQKDIDKLPESEKTLIENLSAHAKDIIGLKPFELRVRGLKFLSQIRLEKTDKGVDIYFFNASGREITVYSISNEKISQIKTTSQTPEEIIEESPRDLKIISLRHEKDRLDRFASGEVLQTILDTGRKAILQYPVKDSFGDHAELYNEFMRKIEPILERAKGQLFLQFVDQEGNLVAGYPSMEAPPGENIPKVLLAAPTEENIKLAAQKDLALLPVQALGQDKDGLPVMAYQADLVLAFGLGTLNADARTQEIDKNNPTLNNLTQLHSQLVDFTHRQAVLEHPVSNFQAMRFPNLSHKDLFQEVLLIVPLTRLNFDEFIQLTGARLAAVGRSA